MRNQFVCAWGFFHICRFYSINEYFLEVAKKKEEKYNKWKERKNFIGRDLSDIECRCVSFKHLSCGTSSSSPLLFVMNKFYDITSISCNHHSCCYDDGFLYWGSSWFGIGDWLSGLEFCGVHHFEFGMWSLKSLVILVLIWSSQ